MTNHPTPPLRQVTDAASTLPPVRTPPETVAERQLPGKPRPYRVALREWEDYRAQVRENLLRNRPDLLPLIPLYYPDPDRLYRWRGQLDCGCVQEILVYGKERSPSGERRCPHNDDPPPPYRSIVSWDERREVSFDADPGDPPADCTKERWAAMRHPEPHTAAFWQVTLTCGHRTDSVAPTLDWKPEDGPRVARPERLEKMIDEFERVEWDEDPRTRDAEEHHARMLLQGWPCPQSEESCYKCPSARFIVAIERVGWLASPDAGKPLPEAPDPRKLMRQLKRAEDRAARLRAELEQLGEDPDTRPQRD